MRTRLQELRKKAGYRSASEFAAAHGISPNTYTAHEQGRREMTLTKAWEYSQMLGCSIDDMIPKENKDASRREYGSIATVKPGVQRVRYWADLPVMTSTEAYRT